MKMWDTRSPNRPVFAEKFKDHWVQDIAVCPKDKSSPSQTTLVATISSRKDEIVFYEFTKK